MAGMFEHTQGKYWGGPWYSYWTLIVISVLGGFIGLDHLWMRSPQTAVLKTLLMIPTLGLWYFYDLLQIFGDKDLVMKYGLSAPVTGALGIGAEMFTDDHPGVKTSKSPFRYLGYLFLTWFPFGFDFFIAGDTNGAMARFLTTILFFLWPIGFIWGCFNIIKATFMPRTLFDYGTTRMFPFNFFMNPTGPSKLGPKDIGLDDTCAPGGSHGFFGGIFHGILGIFQAILGSVAAVLLPGVQPFILAAATAGKAIMDFVRSLFGLSAAVVTEATKPAAAIAGVASKAAQQGAQLATSSALSMPATAVGAQAVGAVGVMRGGAILSQDLVTFPALIFVFVAILGVGSVLGFLELKRQYDLSRNEPARNDASGSNGTKSEKNDTPPKPYVL